MTTKLYDAKHDKDAEYWTVKDFKKLLSFHPDIVGAQSPRNYGKTYALMDYCRDIINRGGDVCWGRYNKVELGQAFNTWMDFMPTLLPMKKTKDSSSAVKWLQNPNTGGRLMLFPWSVSQNIKGIDAPFEIMVCDEFIPERYTKATRRDTEFGDWSSVYKSLARSYGTQPVMLSNNIEWMNPFFLRWGIMPFPKGKICVDDTKFKAEVDGEVYETERRIVFENVAGTPAIIRRNMKQQAIDFTSNEQMERYFENETKQEYMRIGKCPVKDIGLSDIQLRSEGDTLNYRYYNGTYYFERVKPDNTKWMYVSERELVDFEARRVRHPKIAREMEELFNSGQCVFKDGPTLEAFFRYLRRSRTRI